MNDTGKGSVLKTFFRCFPAVCVTGAVLFLGRLAAFSPLLAARSGLLPLPDWQAWTLVFPLYILAVIPLRFWARERLRRLFYTHRHHSHHQSPWPKWLQCGLLRYGRGLLWGLPFLLGAGYFLYGKSNMSYTDMWQPIQNLAALIGKEPSIGVGAPIALALLALAALLFAWGWWLDMPAEYLHVRSLKAGEVFRWSRHIRKNRRGEMIKTALGNALLSLPALIGAGAVLVPYVTEKVDFSLRSDLVFNLLLRLLRSPLPQKQVLALGAVFLLLYAPLFLLRKTRNAAFAARALREHVRAHRQSEDAP